VYSGDLPVESMGKESSKTGKITGKKKRKGQQRWGSGVKKSQFLGKEKKKRQMYEERESNREKAALSSKKWSRYLQGSRNYGGQYKKKKSVSADQPDTEDEEPYQESGLRINLRRRTSKFE